MRERTQVSFSKLQAQGRLLYLNEYSRVCSTGLKYQNGKEKHQCPGLLIVHCSPLLLNLLLADTGNYYLLQGYRWTEVIQNKEMRRVSTRYSQKQNLARPRQIDIGVTIDRHAQTCS